MHEPDGENSMRSGKERLGGAHALTASEIDLLIELGYALWFTVDIFRILSLISNRALGNDERAHITARTYVAVRAPLDRYARAKPSE
jgi:hypothetical protein